MPERWRDLQRWWQTVRPGGPRLPWTEASFSVVDFEATSADPRSAEPLSVGWVRISGGRIRMAESGYSLIRHRGTIPLRSIRVHGLGPDQLTDAPHWWESEAHLSYVVVVHVLGDHGALLELALLRRLGVRPVRGGVLDTMRLLPPADRRIGHRTASTPELSAAAQRHGVPVHRRHHAFGDALTTAGLFLALVHRLSGTRPATVAELRRVGRGPHR